MECKMLSDLSDNQVDFLQRRKERKQMDHAAFTSAERIVQMYPELVKDNKEEGAYRNLAQLLELSSHQRENRQQPVCSFVQQNDLKSAGLKQRK